MFASGDGDRGKGWPVKGGEASASGAGMSFGCLWHGLRTTVDNKFLCMLKSIKWTLALSPPNMCALVNYGYANQRHQNIMAWGSSVSEHMLSMSKALGLIPSTPNKPSACLCLSLSVTYLFIIYLSPLFSSLK